MQKEEKAFGNIFWAILAFKAVVLLLFSSDYQNRLFVPLVTHFLTHFDNPWEFIYRHPQVGMEFPYSPVMLYILAVFYAPAHLLHANAPWAVNLFMKLPTLLADVLIYRLLLAGAGDARKALAYYFASPIIIYACYMHSQVDLIPTALLSVSVFLLTRKNVPWAAVFLGLAMGSKFHVAAAAPLMVIYIWRKMRPVDAAIFCLTAPLVFLFIIFPYYGEAYRALVLNNPKQMLVYDSFIEIGALKLYLPVLLVTIFYARFAAFRKINTDLFYTFLALVFAAFILLTNPAPGWYVWLFPFLSIFFIRYGHMAGEIRKLYIALNAFYLAYMIAFFIPDYADLIFLDTALDFKIHHEKYRNIAFTFLNVALLAVMYSLYKFGVRSNFFYRRNAPTVIAIAGDSASGKTTLLSDLRSLLGEKVLQLEGDADHKWERGDERWNELTHLNPKANFLYRQYEQIVNLRFGTSVYRRDYDHQTGTFSSQQKLRARDYIVLSGLHAFYLPKMRKVIDLKIYADTDEKLRQHWKILRDVKERGYTREKALAQMAARREDAQKYIHPQYGFADMIVHYFTADDYTPGDEQAVLRMKLQLTVDANLPLDAAVACLERHLEVAWDYAEDMATQTVTVNGNLTGALVSELARLTIVNLEDLISDEPVWLDGYRGLVQYFILLNLSEKIKSAPGESHEPV